MEPQVLVDAACCNRAEMHDVDDSELGSHSHPPSTADSEMNTGSLGRDIDHNCADDPGVASANMLLSRGRAKEALELIESSQALQAGSPTALCIRGRCLEALENNPGVCKQLPCWSVIQSSCHNSFSAEAHMLIMP